MAQYKTPGVYIVEKNAFPNSVVEVATAVPAFVGHTETASYKGASLRNKPWRITSMAEFEASFGFGPRPTFTFKPADAADEVDFRAVAKLSDTEKAAADTAATLAQKRAALLAAGDDNAEAAKTDYNTALDAAKEAATAAGKPLSEQQAQESDAVLSSAEGVAASKRRTAVAAKAELDAENDTEAKKGKQAAFDDAEAAALQAEKRFAIESAKAKIADSAARIKAERQRPLVDYHVELTQGKHLLYHSMKLFFQNGGGACYIVSVGDYSKAPDKDVLVAGIETLLKEQEPTMLVIPEAVLLAADDCYSLQQQMLLHCGVTMKNRFALLDVHDGFKELKADPVNHFRNSVTSTALAFGAAYYPWVHTTIVALKDLNFTHLDDDEAQRALLIDLLANELAPALNPDGSNASAELKKKDVEKLLAGLTAKWSDDSAANRLAIADGHNALANISRLYGEILLAMQRKVNLLPPSAAMAGLYTMIDNTRGVWKAPANVGLMSVSAPAVNITHDDQEDLNVSTTGKSINAIRSFIGEGTLVWGARTLDGNSLDWRYINVRRTMIMLEESLRLACKAYVFEPNVANTWVTIKSMARNFLTGIWKRGGLAGASPDDAFSVAVGLDETMTGDDILEGILRVTILVAISRPAEFIEITFQQQMQKS